VPIEFTQRLQVAGAQPGDEFRFIRDSQTGLPAFAKWTNEIASRLRRAGEARPPSSAHARILQPPSAPTDAAKPL